jgi:hypothetical protein
MEKEEEMISDQDVTIEIVETIAIDVMTEGMIVVETTDVGMTVETIVEEAQEEAQCETKEEKIAVKETNFYKLGSLMVCPL